MPEPSVRLPAQARRVLRPLAQAAAKTGLPLYAVGGCVRDWLLGREGVVDWDLVTEGDPASVARLAGRMLGGSVEAFGDFGTWRVQGKRWRADFACAREEEYPEPACLPKVRPSDITRDLFRRDFTINAMAMRLDGPEAGTIVDPYGGRRDLKKSVLRVLHPASFRDDPTRVFRAARFMCRFGLRPASGLREMLRESLRGGIAGRLSRHRISQELLRILAEEDPSASLRKLKAWGYLDLVHPDMPARAAGETVEERLGFLAAGMGEKGGELLRSLPVEHGMALRIGEALRLIKEKASSRTALAPQVARIVSLACPRLPSSALKPLFLRGEDLKAAGLKPGPRFKDILDAVARLQWEGRIRSRRDALSWLVSVGAIR